MAAWTDEQIECLKITVGYDKNSPIRLAHLALCDAVKKKREAYKAFEAAVLAVEQAKADLEFHQSMKKKH